MNVKPKKSLGQHFLTDEDIALRIVEALVPMPGVSGVLEVGPGMGVLTKYLVTNETYQTTIIDLDVESIRYLNEKFPQLGDRIIGADFLNINLTQYFANPFFVIGNFPYNISTQIVFKILENKNLVPQMVGMFQKEVAERLASKPGSRVYGITSVLVQAFYDIEYLFTVSEQVFNPPPKVKSGVIRMVRNGVTNLPCDEVIFKQLVKTAFGQRRKMLRNALGVFQLNSLQGFEPYLTKRAEELSVQDYIDLTRLVTINKKQ